MLELIQKIVDFFFLLLPQKSASKVQIDNTKIIAHRGYHEKNVIENTIPAFQWCEENNIWGIEFDIRFTMDNVPVIHHDSHCGRLFNRQDLSISETIFEDLRKEVPQIPALSEVVSLFGSEIHFMLELKTELTSEQNNILLKTLSSLRPNHNYHILSLEIDIFKSIEFAKTNCFVPVAMLNVSNLLHYTLEYHCAALTGHYLLLNKSHIQKLHSHSIISGVGQIASKNSLMREIRRGHEWIFTDEVSKVKKWLFEISNDQNI
ncbi:MAG: hypothetical protein JXR07_05315 [Reichenbachiella sp.]